jgi:predicted Rossmann-fold nucleotide-binding protein
MSPPACRYNSLFFDSLSEFSSFYQIEIETYLLTSTSKRSMESALEKLVKLARELPNNFLELDPLVIGGGGYRSKQSSLT